ncbi:helix-turn-helix domain-containing protein [Saccharolobus islandicus]|uniref:Bacterio-opsin activator HTH domain protein n=1 Tax=Saccharolobus islandicus (strain M.16.27) TaxID=427318 RepID=C3N1K8_SACI3|nr:helix-turn-helix domain-containing protein [Sulfolobus islandicus]ACP56235.1 Bacterio-opsin activator HTH domain protein [Sulfolobus islandicus M.16.27]
MLSLTYNWKAFKLLKKYELVSHKYINVMVSHHGCWSELTSVNYIDTLINIEYSSFDILKASRIAMIRGSKENIKGQIKNIMTKDRSIIDFDISEIVSDNNKYSIYLISMLQEAENTMISKLRAKGTSIIGTTIRDGKEIYDVIVPRDIKTLVVDAIMKDDKVKIINFVEKDVNEEIIFKVISRNSFEMLLTEKERMLLRKARELGYFNVPRDRNSQELAKQLGVSKMNISFSLRKILKKISDLID